MQNGYIESFNGKMRNELLNETLFFSLGQARKAAAAWVEDYNTRRPHAPLAYETPAACAAKFAATGQGSKSCWMKIQWQVKFRKIARLSHMRPAIGRLPKQRRAATARNHGSRLSSGFRGKPARVPAIPECRRENRRAAVRAD